MLFLQRDISPFAGTTSFICYWISFYSVIYILNLFRFQCHFHRRIFDPMSFSCLVYKLLVFFLHGLLQQYNKSVLPRPKLKLFSSSDIPVYLIYGNTHLEAKCSSNGTVIKSPVIASIKKINISLSGFSKTTLNW